MAASTKSEDLASAFISDLKNVHIENPELVMNYAFGYLLYREKEYVTKQTKESAERKERTYTLKSVDWLEKEVFRKMKAYEMEQNRKDMTSEETIEEDEDMEIEELEQKKWIEQRVSEMITDYQYERVAKEREIKGLEEQAMQVNIYILPFLGDINIISFVKYCNKCLNNDEKIITYLSCVDKKYEYYVTDVSSHQNDAGWCGSDSAGSKLAVSHR